MGSPRKSKSPSKQQQPPVVSVLDSTLRSLQQLVRETSVDQLLSLPEFSQLLDVNHRFKSLPAFQEELERALFKIQAANPPSSTLAKQASHLLEFIRPLLHRHYDALRLKKGVVVVGGGGAKEDSDHLLLDTSSIPPFDPAAYGAGAGAGGEDEDNSTAAYLAKKTRSAAKRKDETIETTFKGQKIALVQKANDGTFYFSSTVQRPFPDKKIKLVVGVNQVNVVPTVALPDSSIPTFGSAATLPVSRPQQRSIIGIPCEAMGNVINNAFMTFAPHLDSNDASISHFDSMAIIKPKYPVLASPRSTRRNTLVAAGGATVGTTSTLKSSATPVSDIYAAIDLVPQIVENGGGISSTGDFLAGAVKALEGEKGVDVELLLKSDFSRLEHDAFVHDIKTMSVDQCLALNALLLKHLAQIQDERMISGVHTVSAAELKLARKTAIILKHLVDFCPPNQLVTISTLQSASNALLQPFDAAYKGTLTKGSVFASNTPGQPLIQPPNAPGVVGVPGATAAMLQQQQPLQQRRPVAPNSAGGNR